jgi:hypothetical protein
VTLEVHRHLGARTCLANMSSELVFILPYKACING